MRACSPHPLAPPRLRGAAAAPAWAGLSLLLALAAAPTLAQPAASALDADAPTAPLVHRPLAASATAAPAIDWRTANATVAAPSDDAADLHGHAAHAPATASMHGHHHGHAAPADAPAPSMHHHHPHGGQP